MHPSSPRPRRRATALLCALPLLAGCFAHDTTIRLNPDGSGTVEQEIVLTGGMAEMMRFARAEDEGAIDLCAERDLGEGVRLLTAELIDEGERVGCRQVYAFADVNALRLEQDPTEALPEGLAPREEVRTAEAPITFSFLPGSPSTLVVRMPQRETAETVEEPVEAPAAERVPEDPASRAMALAMMREMLRSSRLSVHLVVPGEIVETDATHRDGDRVTLVELDFDALLEDPESLERLLEVQDPSPEEARALLARTPGMKVETREEITIRFR
jgi:hypothetical protein